MSLHDTDRAGWSLSCPTSRMSLASGLPRGQGGAGGDGVTWPLAGPQDSTLHPQDSLVSSQEVPGCLEPGQYP